MYIPRCSPGSFRAGVPGRDTEVPSQHSAVDDLDSGFHLVLPRPFLPLCLGDPMRVYGQQRDSDTVCPSFHFEINVFYGSLHNTHYSHPG